MLIFLLIWFGSGAIGSEIGRRHMNKVVGEDRGWGDFEVVMSLLGPMNFFAALIYAST